MFSQASVSLSTIGLMATRSLLILVTARSVPFLLECLPVLLDSFLYHGHACIMNKHLGEQKKKTLQINEISTEVKDYFKWSFATHIYSMNQEIRALKGTTSVVKP